jgi:two-component system, OmpR family, alkaline phosphatase synthesis response regulator PhoP
MSFRDLTARLVSMNRKGLVLLIEDDEATARFMRLALQPEEYSLMVASSRQDALAAMKERKPALIIMDYLMPGLSAPEFIEEARSLAYEGPILLCTALHEDILLPVEDVLYKPFDPKELLERLHVWLPCD